MERNAHVELLRFVGQRNARSEFVLLPDGGGVGCYALGRDAPEHRFQLESTSGPNVDPRAPDGPSLPRSIRVLSSVSGTRAATLRRVGNKSCVVGVHDLARGTHIGDIPIADDARPLTVFLLGDFVLAGGDGIGVFWLGGEQTGWEVIIVPPEIDKMYKGVDFFGISGHGLWAIDNSVMPHYGAGYDLRDPLFDRRPEAYEVARTVNACVRDFTCNDDWLVTLVRSTSGYAGVSCIVTVYAGDLDNRVCEYETERRGLEVVAVAVLADLLLSVWSDGMVATANLRDAQRTGQITWSDKIGVDGFIVDLICVQNPAHAFAIVSDRSALGWRSLDIAQP